MAFPTAAPTLFRIDAAAAVDGAGFFAAPASMLVRLQRHRGASGPRLTVVAAGRTADVSSHPAARSPGIQTIARPGSILIPGLVNAHTHLDLTHLGPRPHDPSEGFVKWVDMVRHGRHQRDEQIADSVRLGLRLSLAAGTVAIGDIAGAPAARISLAPWRTLRRTGIRGVSYLEFFGIGKTTDRAAASVHAALSEAAPEEAAETADTALGLQPHATNTIAPRLYREAVALARRTSPPRPLSTHAAETPEERQLVAHATGPQRELLERLGVWDDSILADFGLGRHPIRHLFEAGVFDAPIALAHVNDATDEAIEILAATRGRASVVYCPHASAYFDTPAHFGPHRYRDMLAAGINVAIGTDSIINLPPAAARTPESGLSLDKASGMSVWQEIRLLHRRDGTDPITLLRMATLGGAAALGLSAGGFAFAEQAPLLGLLAVRLPQGTSGGPEESLSRALGGDLPPEILFAENDSGWIGILGDGDPATPKLGEIGPGTSAERQSTAEASPTP